MAVKSRQTSPSAIWASRMTIWRPTLQRNPVPAGLQKRDLLWGDVRELHQIRVFEELRLVAECVQLLCQ